MIRIVHRKSEKFIFILEDHQKALSKETQENPELADVTALKNNAVYALPFYADCGVLEYPIKLNKWACMFK